MPSNNDVALKTIAIVRIVLGWIFMWAFLDKLLGLGYATKAGANWLNGVSPTSGFLSKAVYGPFSDLYHQLAGNPIVDWLFMLGLLGVGTACLLGIATRLAGWSGALMMLLMYFALFPPKNNPIIDEHIIYFILFIGIASTNSGDIWGLGRGWKKFVGEKLTWLH